VGTKTDEEIIQSSETNDRDLVQLAGDHAYRYIESPDKIEVNGKEYRVIDNCYDTASGLDAMTIERIGTDDNEVSVIFVGSDQIKGDWIDTNLNLVGEAEPEQLADAKKYFEEMEAEHGPIKFVAGNSLGGALANSVAVEYSDVESVTLNPAMLPGDLVDASKHYSNIRNYQGEYDVLTHVQEAINYDHRVPGTNYDIQNGLPIFSLFKSNHTGYAKDENGEYRIEIGKEGKPGHGFIHVGADDHIVLSLWSGAPLKEGTNVPIDISVGDMMYFVSGIKTEVAGRLNLAGEYIQNAVEIVDDESSRFNERVTTLQKELENLLDGLVTGPLSAGVSGIGSAINFLLEGILGVLEYAERKLAFLNIVLNSAPAEMIESFLSIDVSVETIFAPPKKLVNNAIEEVENLVAGIDNIIHQDIPAIFSGGKDMFVDAVVGELSAHYRVVEDSKDGLLSQMEGYKTQVQGVAAAFEQVDEELGFAIAANRLPSEGKNIVPEASQLKVPKSDYLENRLSIKEIHVKLAHHDFKRKATMTLSPILSRLEIILFSVELALESALSTINSVANVAAYNPVGLLVNIFTDYVERVKSAAAEVAAPIKDLQERVANLKRGIQEANRNLPELLDYFERYIDVAIFTPGNYKNVELYNIASRAILSEMEILFRDIVFQLSNQKAKAIEGTVRTSETLLENIEIVKINVDKGTSV